jgi:UDP-glucose 4-epimerase
MIEEKIMKNKHLVITGGAGFIGSNLARELAKDNEVTVIDDLSTGLLKNIKDLIKTKKINFIKGNITNEKLLQKTFRDVDYVFHQAAIASVPKSIEDPIKSNDVNINGTLNVLVAARDNNIKKVVFASSCSIYGDSPALPKTEFMIPCPISPYSVNKLVGEYYCNVFTKVYNLKTAALRYFNVYGPRQDPGGDYAAVVPRFINMVLKNKVPIIYGDGEQTRDFIYVDDIVNANIIAAESKETGIFNIAAGKPVSINELTQYITQITGKKIQAVYKKPRQGDIIHSSADISKAKQKLGYEPKFALKKGLEETIKWFQSQKKK